MFLERSHCWNYDQKTIQKEEEVPIVALIKENNIKQQIVTLSSCTCGVANIHLIIPQWRWHTLSIMQQTMQKSLDNISFILVNYQCRSCTKLSIPRTIYKTNGMGTRKQRKQQFIKNESEACGKTFKHGKFEVSKINQL